MYIIEVIPLTTFPPQVPQLLSYYFNKPLLKGAVVEVLIGNRRVAAAVVSATSVEEQKASLKRSDFQLKKISSVLSENPLISDIQFKIALWLSKNYYAPLGICLKTVLPAFFLKKNYEYVITNKEMGGSINKPSVLLSQAKNIIKNIEPEIKKVLKNKKQVLLIVPEISATRYFYDYFAGYYETTVIHSKIPLKQFHKNWNKICSGDAEIIIGTRQALFAPFFDLGLVIVEDPSNEAFKSDMSPKYNTPDLAKKISDIYSADILFVTQIPDMTGHALANNGTYLLSDRRTNIKTDVSFENMVQEIRGGNFSIFSRELRRNLEEGIKGDKKILIFSTRKGYSSYLICENCGFSFNCPKCSVPLKVYRSPEQILICHRCSTSQKIPDTCPNCHSYKLKNAGFAGSERIKEELVRILESNNSKKDIIVLDSDSDKNLSEDESAIYIATQSIFSRRFSMNFDIIGIPNLDSLTTTPDFRAEENVFIQFGKLLDFQPEIIIGQTYNPDTHMLSLLKKVNYLEFYERELQSRQLFGYPPFTRLIKLSHTSPDKKKAEYEARVLSEKLKMAIIQRKMENTIRLMGPSPAFVEKEKNLYIYNIILKISPEQRPDEILRFVPSHWMINVDPKSIL